MLCIPSPITTSIASARLLKTTTSMVLPVSVWRTVIFSLFIGQLFKQFCQLRAQIASRLGGGGGIGGDGGAFLQAAGDAIAVDGTEDARELREAAGAIVDVAAEDRAASLIEGVVRAGGN